MLFWWICGGESVLPVLLLRHLGSSPLTSQHHFHNIRAWVITYFFLEKSFEKFFHLSFPCFLFSFILGIPFTFLLSLFTHFTDFMPSSFFYSLVQKAASFSNLVRLKRTKNMVTAAQSCLLNCTASIWISALRVFSLHYASLSFLSSFGFFLCFLIPWFIPIFW